MTVIHNFKRFISYREALLLKTPSSGGQKFTGVSGVFVFLGPGSAGGLAPHSLQHSHDQHQPAAAGGFRRGHPGVLPRARRPAARRGAEPAGQVRRLSVQQRHGHGPGGPLPDSTGSLFYICLIIQS